MCTLRPLPSSSLIIVFSDDRTLAVPWIPRSRSLSSSYPRLRLAFLNRPINPTPCAVRSAHLSQLTFKLADLVAEASRLLEAEILGRVVHLVLECLDELADVVRRDPLEIEDRRTLGSPSASTPPASTDAYVVVFSLTGAHHLEDVDDLLADRLRIDPVPGVELELHLPPAVRLGDGAAHRVRDLVGVHDHLTVDVAGGATHGLDQRRVGAQEALLVGVEDRHQRHLGKVEALTQQVDTDEHVELAEAKRAQDLDPLERVDLAVQVP